jgi:UDP-3-O-[3-hydroxymyristoyl] N-acetylglucosamine deacetylase
LSIACSKKDLELTSAKLTKTQKTLAKEISVEGIGLFTGERVALRLIPAEENSGVLFQRIDLPQKNVIPAVVQNVISSSRCTIIKKEEASVQTIEHLMAALAALEVDNVLIEVSGLEVPIFDGSSAPFVELIKNAGIVLQDAETPIFTLSRPLYFSQKDVQMVALPSEEYRVSYTLHYPQSPFLRSQFYSSCISAEIFSAEIAPSRTFSLYEEVMPLLEKGFIKGGSLENGVIVKGNEVLNPEGVRFPDEMVRHKVLDLVGDLALVGHAFRTHIIAIRSGHAANHALANELYKQIKMENP